MYKPGGTIAEALDRIQKKQYVLPAIQREFVWQPEQIERLFDSLMQGYPFGTFLFWRVEPSTSGKFKFFDFVLNYHQRDAAHCPDLAVLHNQAVTAVLDGQQRLTALNIGLRGSMARKAPYKWWNSPDAFPRKTLCLNLLAPIAADDDGARYGFRFLTEEQQAERDNDTLWFRVPEILAMKAGPEMLSWLIRHELPSDRLNTAFEILDRLFNVVHNKPQLSYYEEEGQDIERVLNIFIRLNSGGTVLSYSDLLLSVATAQWKQLDARAEIHRIVDELNRTGAGFGLSKDFVLKAGLMLADIKSVGFKVENFTAENMAVLEAEWPAIRNALIRTVELVSSFGMNQQTLRADSALLPIAYYLHRRGAPSNYVLSSQYADDRDAIRQWLIRSLLKASGIWGSGLDMLDPLETTDAVDCGAPTAGTAPHPRLGDGSDRPARAVDRLDVLPLVPCPSGPEVRTGRLVGWNPSRRPPRHQPRSIPATLRRATGLEGDRDPAKWTLVDIEVADDLGAVRNGMTYNREYGTSATFYEKPRRNQFLEGPNEPAVADYMEMAPRHLDFQFQWAALVFKRADGRIIRRYPDVAIEYDDNEVAFGEIKTSRAWFEAPGVKRPLDAMDRAMVSAGLKPLLRIRGEAFRSEAALEAHAAAMDGRLTVYDPDEDVRRVHETVRANGGRVGHGALVAALGGPRAVAADVLHAMLLRRVVAFDLSAPPTRDTPVTLPRPARAHALRSLLERLRQRRVA